MEKELAVLKCLFNKYDTLLKGYLTIKEFDTLLTVLSDEITALKNRGSEATEALYRFLAKDSDVLYFEEFSEWWVEYDFMLFTKNKDLFLRAFRLFVVYAESSNNMKKSGFRKLVSDVDTLSTQNDFFALDTNEDSKITFNEFCSWLKWW